ncbi:hypothetical protein Slin14017_G086050 [Septoria linicola]|nr:hypothetical protein Slin14017_G086050 [Septoria linicola]
MVNSDIYDIDSYSSDFGTTKPQNSVRKPRQSHKLNNINTSSTNSSHRASKKSATAELEMVKQGTDSPGGKSGKGKKSRKEIKEEEELQAKKQELNQLGRAIRGLHVEFQQYIEEALEVLNNHRRYNDSQEGLRGTVRLARLRFSHHGRQGPIQPRDHRRRLAQHFRLASHESRVGGGDKSSIESFVNGDTIRYHNEVVDHHTTLQAAAKKAFVLTLDALRSFERRQRKFIQSIGYHNGITAVSGGDGNDRNDQAAIIIPMIEEVLNDNSKLMLLEAPYEEKWQEICKAMSSVLIHEAADFVATAIAALEVDTRGKLEYLEFPQLRVRAE